MPTTTILTYELKFEDINRRVMAWIKDFIRQQEVRFFEQTALFCYQTILRYLFFKELRLTPTPGRRPRQMLITAKQISSRVSVNIFR